jgi:hypothetical protein
MLPASTRPPTATDDRRNRLLSARQAEAYDWFVDRPQFPIVEWTTLAACHDVCSRYCERFWLPIIGPTAYLAGRRLADELGDVDAGELVYVDLVELGSSLGVGTGTGRHTSINRSLIRLQDYGLVQQVDEQLQVRLGWPELPPRHQRRLNESLRSELETADPAEPSFEVES